MTALQGRLLAHLADFPLVRRVLENLLTARGRRHLARLDRLPAERAQLRTLLGLIHRAQSTPFGQDHDFARIRTVHDFRRLVPLRETGDLVREYPQADLRWRATDAPHAVSPPSPGEPSFPFVFSSELLGAHRRAIRTALALAHQARPRLRLLDGSVLWLGDHLVVTRPGHSAADHFARARFPFSLRFALNDGSIENSRHPDENLTCIVGSSDRIGSFVEQVRQLCGDEDLARLWPKLQLIISSTHPCTDASQQPRTLVGDQIHLLELFFAPEAPLAVADHRLGGYRLLIDHGVFFEFIPIDHANDLYPPRLGIEQVELGVPYEVALSSPAGVWARKSGLIVSFSQLSPPVIDLQPASRSVLPTIRINEPAVLGPLVPHRSADGSPEVQPETSSHIPWSARADRG